MDLVAPIDKFYKKDWEYYKWSMPTSRFFGYHDYMIEYHKTQTPEDIKAKKVKDADWDDEVKELKRKLKNG